MISRVFAIVAAHDGGAATERTLAAIEAGSVRPEQVLRYEARGATGFGEAINHAVLQLPEPEAGDWLWLLAHDAEPHSEALAALTAAAEANTRLAIVGPKVMRAADPTTFEAFGETMTRFGRAVRLSPGDLDQGQHDGRSDVLAVTESGMLVRRDVFSALGGFDPQLDVVDAGLDLGVRARLAGHQVAVVPQARVLRDGGPELWRTRAVSAGGLAYAVRRAQLHRRLVYANPVALVFHWLLLLPIALVRSIGQLFSRRPAAALAELQAALAALVSFSSVSAARRRIRRTKTAPWSALQSLRIDRQTLKLRRRLAGAEAMANDVRVDERAGVVRSGALWAAGLALLLGVVLMGRTLLGGGVSTGGALLPLGDFTTMWQHALAGQRDALGGVRGPADPLMVVLAMLGSLTFWQPSLAVTLVLTLAPLLAVCTAWALLRRVIRHPWAPSVLALCWGIAPPLLHAIGDGRIGAVLAHVALPLIGYGLLRGIHAFAAIGAALTIAGAPSLAPLVAVVFLIAIGWRLARGRVGESLAALLATLPAAALLAPLVAYWVGEGRPFAWLADPGGTLTASTELPTWWFWLLAVPLALVVIVGCFLRPAPAVTGALVAAGGMLTAVAQHELGLWPGTGVGVVVLGALIVAAGGLEGLDRFAGIAGALVALAGVGAAGVAGAGLLSGAMLVHPVEGRALPAIVQAGAATDPDIRTAILTPTGPDRVEVQVVRGAERTLGAEQTVRTMHTALNDAERELAQVVMDAANGGSGDLAVLAERYGIRYILLTPGEGAGQSLGDALAQGLTSHSALSPVGETDLGQLWQTADAVSVPGERWSAATGALLIAQVALLVVALLGTFPTARALRGTRRRKVRA